MKIYIFENWKFPIIENEKIDLFWNAASFQEMEPDKAANYMMLINDKTKAVFLMEAMRGKGVASKEGKLGVLKQTTIDDYKGTVGLSNFTLRDISPVFGR